MRRKSWTPFGENDIEVFGDDLQTAKAGLLATENAFAPASRAELVKALSAVAFVTIPRTENQEDRRATMFAMAHGLSTLPGDLVLKQIAAYRGKFFPALDDIREPIERSTAFLRRMKVRRAFRELVANLEAAPKKASA